MSGIYFTAAAVARFCLIVFSHKPTLFLQDLSRINRNHSRVLFLDCNADAVSNVEDNSLVIPSWDGSNEDRYIFDLMPLLVG